MDTSIFQEVVWPHRSAVEYFPGSHARAFTINYAKLKWTKTLPNKNPA